MTRRYLRSAALAAAVLAAPAAASPAARQIALPAGPMAAALAQLVRQSGVELLFDPALVRNLKSRRVAGRLTAAQALSKLLEGSGVGFRKSGGAFVLYPLPAPDRADRPAPAAPDILITGRRTQNADIRRTENDIQPYRVLDRAEIRDSHRDTVEEFLRSAETADAQTAAPGQIVENADPRSSIDLRGAGSSRTLVLVDGRRMPSVPTMRFDSVQPDLNGIPLTAIERIEILTGSAGGIYGPGALGGVLNVILRRDYNGADLRIATGVTSRGDAATASIEGRIGLSFNHGRTGVTLVAGTRTAEPLRRGERDFELRRRLLQFRNDPAGYVRQRLKATTSAVLPRSDAITVASVNGANLVLDPQYGGSTLASSYSFLPPDFAGTPAEAIALLKQNAGTLRFEPADDLAGGRAYLGARPSATSVLLNVRQSLGSGAEAYMDGLWLKNRAVSEIATAEEAVTLPDAPTNPFSQLVFFTFPRPELVGRYEQRIDTRRLSTGIILGPPKGWRATADLTLGSVSVDRTGLSQVINFDLLRAIQTGRSARPGLPVPDPLGGLPRLAAALAEYRETSLLDQRLENRFMDASVRVSGPLLKLRGGPLTATAVLEWRREHVPATERTIRFTERTDVVESSERTQRVASASVELRAPLTGPKPPLPILRGLELQLAARYDHAVTDYVDGFGVALGFEDPPTRSRRNAVTYTAGIRAFPAPFLMIRASTATGELPPTIDNLRSTASAFRLNDPALGDPQRGGRPIGSERPFRLLYGGSPDSLPEKSRTLSVGAVLNPSAANAPRLSIDYSMIRKVREPFALVDLFFDRDSALARLPGVLASEGFGSSRVIRLPLTEADRALGFTGGIVSEIDGRGVNPGRSVVKVLDLNVEWRLTLGSGSLLLHGRGTWLPSLRRRGSDRDPWFQSAGFADGPLEWRANGGIAWSGRGSTVALTAQYFGSYSPAYSAPQMQAFNPTILRFHAGARIPDRLYFDLAVRHRLGRRAPGLELGLGIINLFDKSPPLTADPQTPGYSFYGDPRRRRFHLALSSSF